MPGTVLVVDSDPSTRQLVESVLSSQGYRVLAESSGEWAMALLGAWSVDLVLAGTRLSDMSADGLRAHLSAPHDPPMWVLGIDIPRPVEPEAVLAAVRSALGSGRPKNPSQPSLEFASADLAEVPFARLYGRLAERNESGALLIQNSGIQKIVFIESGLPVFIQSNQRGESLGQVLVQQGLLSRLELDGAMQARRQSDRTLGELLVARGLLSESQLGEALVRQMEQKWFDLFHWSEGNAVHRAKARYRGPRVGLPYSRLGLLVEGIRRGMQAVQVQDQLRPDRGRLVKARDPDRVRDQLLHLEPASEVLCGLLDGSRTVDHLLREGGLEPGTAAALLWGLILLGEVQLETAELFALSEPLRRQVRARVESELVRIQRGRSREAPDAEALSARVRRTAGRLAGLDLFRVLDVPDSASMETVRQAYRAVSPELDPARLLSGQPEPEVIKAAESNHLAAVRAFHVLTDGDGVEDYRAWLRDPKDDRHPVLRAEDAVEEARRKLWADDFDGAERCYRDALTLWDDPYWRAEMKLVQAMRNPEDGVEIAEACRSQFPSDPRLNALCGLVLERARRNNDAEQALQVAVAQDPTCPWVRRSHLPAPVRPPKPSKRRVPWVQ